MELYVPASILFLSIACFINAALIGRVEKKMDKLLKLKEKEEVLKEINFLRESNNE